MKNHEVWQAVRDAKLAGVTNLHRSPVKNHRFAQPVRNCRDHSHILAHLYACNHVHKFGGDFTQFGLCHEPIASCVGFNMM